MTNASERYNTSLWEYFSPTPPIPGFSTVESHRRVSDGAGALSFYTTAFLMGGTVNWRGYYSRGGPGETKTGGCPKSEIARVKIMLGGSQGSPREISPSLLPQTMNTFENPGKPSTRKRYFRGRAGRVRAGGFFISNSGDSRGGFLFDLHLRFFEFKRLPKMQGPLSVRFGWVV